MESAFNQIFGERWNPWYQLGALSFYFFWIVTVTGLYLFIFFDTSISGAFESMEALTNNQWIAGGIMRKDTTTAKLTEFEIERNKAISKFRYIVEQYFGISHLHDGVYPVRYSNIILT